MQLPGGTSVQPGKKTERLQQVDWWCKKGSSFKSFIIFYFHGRISFSPDLKFYLFPPQAVMPPLSFYQKIIATSNLSNCPALGSGGIVEVTL